MLSHPLHDAVKVDMGDIGRDAELFRFPYFNDSIRRIDEDLGGDSTRIQAGTAHGTPVHDGDGFLVLQRVFNEIRARPGADDDHVIFLHCSPLEVL